MNQWITISELKEICHQAAEVYEASEIGIGPTARHIYFFVLVRLQKQGQSFLSADDPLTDQAQVTLQAQAALVARFLADWGETVDELKNGDEYAWELLRLQMEKVVQPFNCLQEDKADALQDALWRIFGLMQQMVEMSPLVSDEVDLVPWVSANKTNLSNVYDFSSPFYPFAKTVAKHRLLSLLRRHSRDAERLTAIEDLPASNQPAISEAEAMEMEATSYLQQELRTKLLALFEAMETQLTRKPRLVLYHTFAIRPQFWELIWFTEVSPPEGIPTQANEFASDTDIAAQLDMNENSVRSNRTQGRNRIAHFDPDLGELLNNLTLAR